MKHIEPSRELYRRVRAGFVLQDTSLRAWCDANGTTTTMVQRAVVGSWNGPAAKVLRAKVVKAAKADQLAQASA